MLRAAEGETAGTVGRGRGRAGEAALQHPDPRRARGEGLGDFRAEGGSEFGAGAGAEFLELRSALAGGRGGVGVDALGLGCVGFAGGGDAVGGGGGEADAGDEGIERAEFGVGAATQRGVGIVADGGADISLKLFLRVAASA